MYNYINFKWTEITKNGRQLYFAMSKLARHYHKLGYNNNNKNKLINGFERLREVNKEMNSTLEEQRMEDEYIFNHFVME